MEFELPGGTHYIGLGLGCEDSSKCDMVVGQEGADGTLEVHDYWEPHGDGLPEEDTSLGGTMDVVTVSATSGYWTSSVRFKRKLDTGDQYDAVLTKGPTNMVYAWCDPASGCNGVTEAHSPQDWEIINVDLSGATTTVVEKGGRNIGFFLSGRAASVGASSAPTHLDGVVDRNNDTFVERRLS